MRILLLDIAWLSGILEGEGSFLWHHTTKEKPLSGRPRIQLQMTDKDVVEKVSKLFKSTLSGPYGPYGQSKKQTWYTQCSGKGAVEWMLTLYSFMGKRRKQAIETVVAQWKGVPA